MDRPGKVAVPATAATVAVPESVPPEGEPTPMATVTLAVEEVRLLAASRSWTVGAGVIETPETVLVGGRAKVRTVVTQAARMKSLARAQVRMPLEASSL